MDHYVATLISIAIVFDAAKADFQEPRCFSYYDFQEKLLEKTIVMSNRMDNLEKMFAVKQQEYDDQAVKIKTDKSEMENDIADIEKNIKKLTTTVKDQAETIQRTYRESVSAIEQRIDELMTSSEAQIARLSTETQIYTNKTREDLKALVKESVKPNVAFLARSVTNTSPGINKKLVFTTALMNTDNCYSTKTGVFISPVHGTYWFSTQFCSYRQKSVNFRIYVNNVMMSDTIKYGGSGAHDCVSSNTVAVLRKGDKVYVKTGPNTSSDVVIHQGDYRWSMFM